MTTPNSPQDPFNVQGLIGRKIAESLGQELVNGIMGGGAKRGLEAGMSLAKDVKLGDIFSTVEKVFEDVNSARASATAAATAKQEEAKEVHIPFMKDEEKSSPAPTPSAPTIRIVPNPVATPANADAPKVKAPVAPPAPVVSDDIPSADDSIDAIYDLATKNLTSEEQSILVSSVMNLVRHASPEGFTGEHVRWLSRLYGNKAL